MDRGSPDAPRRAPLRSRGPSPRVVAISVTTSGPEASSTDDWESHWSSFADSNALNPAQAYRRRLIFGALDLGRAPRPVRLLELGSGQGDFARDVLAAHPGVDFVGL